jgi:hypothetical protein
MQTVKPRVPAWLIVVYILALATILAWPFIAFMSVFAFDAPGSAENPAVWTGVILVLAYPLLPLVGVPGSFFAYRKNLKKLAYVLLVIGGVPLVILVIALIAMFASSAAYMLGARF